RSAENLRPSACAKSPPRSLHRKLHHIFVVPGGSKRIAHSDTRDRAAGFTRARLADMMSHMLEGDAGTQVLQPVFPGTPDLLSPGDAIAGWLLDPPGALVQFVKPVKGTMELASWLVGPAFEVLDERFPGRNDLTFVLDLGNMVGRSAA